MTTERDKFVRVEFSRFKAFEKFTLDLRHFNILVGPNNAGKSTVLAAFRILEAAMRTARARRPVILRGPQGETHGYYVDIRAISVAEENIFHNYQDSDPALVTFHLSNKHTLTLYFPETGTCILLTDTKGRAITEPSKFRSHFNCPIGFVPILGPVEHQEQLYNEETARRSLYTYNAARNFRNIWYHQRENFSDFQKLLRLTWPGMDIEPPEVDRSYGKPRLHMYCPENRMPRELFWAGFGFQVWVQMLTHLIKSSEASIFLIDEPDIYLHSELQRQLVGLLRNLGPDILVATHSTEIITEAETDDIVLITKGRRRASRIRNPSQLNEVFRLLGSTINPVLTQVAKTRRVLFVEGKDFQIISRFALRLGFPKVSNRSEFAVVPIEGFNPERVRHLKEGMEQSLGSGIVAAVLLDRDYRSEAECDAIVDKCERFCDFVTILKRKEIENFLLVPTAIDRAAAKKVADQSKRTNVRASYSPQVINILNEFSTSKREYVASQRIGVQRAFERSTASGVNDATSIQAALTAFQRLWEDETSRLACVPGKEAISAINGRLQERFGVSVTPTSIIDAMTEEEVPQEMVELLKKLQKFAGTTPGAIVS